MVISNRPRQTMIILGAGIGGLATGCYAQMNGYRSRVFELHDVPGGCCTDWKHGEFTFDGSMSWLLGSGPGNELYQIWLELGALHGKEVRHFELFNAVETADGHIVRFYSDPDRLQDHLTELSPADGRRIRAFCHGLRQFQKCVAAAPVLRPVGLMGRLDKLRMYLRFAPFYRLITRSIATRIAGCAARFESPVLREAFHHVLYEDAPEQSLLGLYCLLASHANRAAGVPEGGWSGVARSIEARYLSLGGQVRYRAGVEEILVENDRAIGVRLSDDQRHFADVVVIAGDGHPELLGRLLGRLPDRLPGRCAIEAGHPLATDPTDPPCAVSSGQFTLFLGLDRRFPEAEHCTTHLLTEDEAAELPGIVHPSIHVQFRNRHYPELSPPGSSVVFASYACDVARWRALNQGEDRPGRQRRGIEVRTLTLPRVRSYPQEKRRVAEFLTGYLDRKYPGLARALVVRDVASPLTSLRCAGNHSDAVLPWQPFLPDGDGVDPGIAPHRPVLPGVRNLYVAEASGATGGLIGAAAAGRHVVQFICRDDRKRFTAWTEDSVAPPSHVIVPPGGPRMAGPDRRPGSARGAIGPVPPAARRRPA
jgi:phytoene dehydrogenase-like protein